LLATGPFDLCVIGEAHEVFSDVHKRFDNFGQCRATAHMREQPGSIMAQE
jgi:hypothetical protein